jgi:nucleoid DNA-binding protein
MANVKQKAKIRFKSKEVEESILEMLLANGKVKVGKLGIFEIRRTKPRRGFNISTGTIHTVPEYNRLSFTPSKTFKREIQKYEETGD